MSKPTWIGYQLSNRYVIDALLGQGGMSTVYRGQDPNLRRTVAIKLIHGHLASNPEFVRRFEEEAAAVASLRHPHIVQVYDFNQDADTFYMVLEYVEGVTLEDKLHALNQFGHKLPLADVQSIMSELCSAVGYAHNQGMIHRDLKPANVMIRPDGTATLMDFGVAKMLGGEQHTATGAVMGTVSYMAPEQIRGLRVDHRADLYALGVILYEMVTGQRPFMGDNSASTMMMHLTQPVPDLRQVVRQEMPAANLGMLANVVQRAMAKEPDERYQSAAEMLADLLGQEMPAGAAVPVSQEQTTLYPTFPTQAGQPAYTQAAQPSYTQLREPAQTQLFSAAEPAPTRTYWPWLMGGLVGVIALLVAALLLTRGGQLSVEESLSATATAEQGLLLTLDRDQDGLTNAEELNLGSDPDVSDSDGDGLEDGYEVRIPCLDPLLSDTDGDGFSDGEDDDPCTAAQSPFHTEITAIRLVYSTAPAPADPYGYDSAPTNPDQAEPTTVPEIRYEIAFITEGFVPEPPSIDGSHHVHFYFNTLTQDDAGLPGNGPWSLYAGPSPYIDPNNTPLTRPQGATQLCIAVANFNHTLVKNTGNCFDLPAEDAAPEPAAEGRLPQLLAKIGRVPTAELVCLIP